MSEGAAMTRRILQTSSTFGEVLNVSALAEARMKMPPMPRMYRVGRNVLVLSLTRHMVTIQKRQAKQGR